MIHRIARSLLYLWALPTTLASVPFLLTATFDGQIRSVDGVLEIHGRFTSFFLSRIVGLTLSGGAKAMTLGHVVLGLNQSALDQTRRHERVHVRQCEIFGPFFLPAYLLSSLLLLLMRRDPYRQNPFERQAFAVEDASNKLQ
ncbi:MAG TPA: hypothetical protein VMD30_06445 [Tepidisphaeraceae bacterium]|nr:hypothetical protein [Tepidisphaeraceae bacterium]